MSLRNLLVHIDNSPSNDSRLELALGLTARLDAFLTGCYTIPSIDPSIYADSTVFNSTYQDAVYAIEDDSKTAERGFRERSEAMGISHCWLAKTGHAVSNLVEAGRYADLCIIGQDAVDPARHGDVDVAEHLPTELGKPVLIVPQFGDFPEAGRRILVAWDASREAARAVNDSLPFLQSAEQVDILHMYPQTDPDGSPDVANRLCAPLERNGISARAHELPLNGMDVSDALLSLAADLRSDLVVMGAYGHSRLREYLFGGATRNVLNQMTVPVLMAH